MNRKEIKKFTNSEVMMVNTNDFIQYGIIESVSTDTTRIKTPNGNIAILNKDIKFIKDIVVRWNK